ncbi:hypothetical protein J4Q44_G00073820 [Coregonus suidteri]|uniref:Uncharacterized protein n=1 Tax=Coregonus suidteri TaxID=861788 RepID=A0AAN8M0X3_9TELE
MAWWSAAPRKLLPGVRGESEIPSGSEGVRRSGRTEEESQQPRPGLRDPTRWIPGGTERTRRPRESSVQVPEYTPDVRCMDRPACGLLEETAERKK